MMIPRPKVKCRVCGRNPAEEVSTYCRKCVLGSCRLVCDFLTTNMCDVYISRTGRKPDKVLFNVDVSPYEKLFKGALRGRQRPKRWLQFCKPFSGQVEYAEFKVSTVVEKPDLVVRILRKKINKYPVKLNGLLRRYWSLDLRENVQGP